MQQRKILFIDHTAVLGGAELSLLDLAAAYRHQSKVLLFADGVLRSRLESVGVEVKVIEVSEKVLKIRASGGLNALKTIPELWLLAGIVAEEAKKFDLIHANSQKAFVVAALATLRNSPPVVWYLHDILTAQHFSAINRRLAVTLANRFAAKVLVNSQATGKAFVAAGGKKALTSLVYNGFNSKPFDRVTTQEARQLRESLGLEDVPVVGLFSRLSYWKGQHILLSALKELPQIHALFVGDVLFGEEEYFTYLKNLADEPELKNRVHWLGFRDDIPSLMKACDAIAHTSTEPEPFGRVIVEGQLARRPTIASAAGGALELIEDEISGLLFPPGDAIALSKQIQKVIGNRDFADALAERGYNSAKAKFNLETILTSFEEGISKI